MAHGYIGGKAFSYRIMPHKIMRDEYPQEYYKFHNLKVAKAFFQDSLGREVIQLPRRLVREPK